MHAIFRICITIVILTSGVRPLLLHFGLTFDE